MIKIKLNPDTVISHTVTNVRPAIHITQFGMSPSEERRCILLAEKMAKKCEAALDTFDPELIDAYKP